MKGDSDGIKTFLFCIQQELLGNVYLNGKFPAQRPFAPFIRHGKPDIYITAGTVVTELLYLIAGVECKVGNSVISCHPQKLERFYRVASYDPVFVYAH